MLVSSPLVLVGILPAVACAGTRVTHGHSSVPRPPQRPPETSVTAPDVPPEAAGGASPAVPAGTPAPLADELARWAAEGLVSEEQVTAILAWERARAASASDGRRPVARARTGGVRRGTRIPVVAEALGYLGGTLGTVGLALIVSRYWPDMATAARVALSASGAAALLGAGALVRELADPALARLRWFLWLGSAGATALCAGVLADGFGADDPRGVAAAYGAALALHSGPLWWNRVRPLQQVAALGGLAVAAGASVATLAGDGPGGLVIMVLAAAYIGLGLRSTRPVPELTVAAGTVTAVAGAVVTFGAWQGPGLIVMVATALALLGIAAVPGVAARPADRRTTAIVGSVALAQAAPSTIAYFAHDAGFATGAATWLIGGGLLAAASRRTVRLPHIAEALGGAAMLAGAAVTATQWPSVAPVLGVVTSIALVAVGTLPRRVVLSIVGAVGMLVNVPWAIGRLFPGEGRAPVLIIVAGAVLVGVAVLLTRRSERFRHELRGDRAHRSPG